eukprot:4541742-Ditylum_brightwellii.AAC.1
MAKVRNKIGHADKKYESGLITSLLIPVTWPSSDCDENQIRPWTIQKRHITGEQWRHHEKLPSI